MCFPLVFFIDHWLYVISFDNPNGGQPMLNMSHLSKGWVSLPRPNNFLYPAIDYELATLIVDGGHSNETTLYVKSRDGYILLAFSFKDQTWYTYTIGKPLTPLTCHLLSLSWWDHLVIVENHLYSFQRNKSQFLLIIRDLESVPDNKVDEGTITWNRVKVPIISPATSPFLTVKENPFFIRGALPSSSRTKAIAATVKTYEWRQVVVIYEDSPTGIVPYLTDALLEVNTKVSYRSVISPSVNDDQILKELYNLNTMQTRVFVMQLQPNLASRLFLKAKEAGMMSSGYAWIITEVLPSLLDSVDHSVIESSMQGVLGIKPYIPRSNELSSFTKRWRKRFRQEFPDMDPVELNVFGLWAYDSITALAKALAKMRITTIPKFKKADTGDNLTDLDAIGTS
ncbi:hypothetical protein T459_17283 [Capsicum annuum]|uniref:Receptor ligand binding region domain-containing protein n=1 Tax=Capsicum annuum TaxID=4072 RepID=A0A2G2ZBE6_CAPAN|nr:hypothetical protein T459_17283 [Capsicum annuum]